jgi:integrase/recombinase XerD
MYLGRLTVLLYVEQTDGVRLASIRPALLCRIRLSYSMAWRLFRKFTDGLQDNGQPLTIHQLRHSFGSERAGEMDALILRDLMGHRSLRTTLQYAQVNGESVKKAFGAFDRQRGK